MESAFLYELASLLRVFVIFVIFVVALGTAQSS